MKAIFVVVDRIKEQPVYTHLRSSSRDKQTEEWGELWKDMLPSANLRTGPRSEEAIIGS